MKSRKVPCIEIWALFTASTVCLFFMLATPVSHASDCRDFCGDCECTTVPACVGSPQGGHCGGDQCGCVTSWICPCKEEQCASTPCPCHLPGCDVCPGVPQAGCGQGTLGNCVPELAGCYCQGSFKCSKCGPRCPLSSTRPCSSSPSGCAMSVAQECSHIFGICNDQKVWHCGSGCCGGYCTYHPPCGCSAYWCGCDAIDCVCN